MTIQQVRLSQGQRLRLVPHEMGRLGEAVAHLDGQPVFVFGGIPGEEAQVEVVRERREYIAARVVEAVKPSLHRVAAPCPYFGACTGCQWQHISYEHQLRMKRDRVVQALEGTGGLSEPPVQPTLAAPAPYAYRNHARLTVGPGGALGFVNRETRHLVAIDRCLLMHPWINQTLFVLQGRCEETTQLSIRYGVRTGSWLIQPSLHNPDIPLATGQKHYQEKVGDRVFRVAAASFFQVNTEQAERLADLVRERLGLLGTELLVDAYAGVGTFAALLAPFVRKVVAIEESPAAVKDAQDNIQGLSNVELRLGKAEDVLGQMETAPDAVVLDPPRTGCHPRVLEALDRLAPRRVVYVSCDPEALARDLRQLCAGPFRLLDVQPVDMFPQTHHVEAVATLALDPEKEARLAKRQHLVLASASPRRRDILRAMGLAFEVVPPPDAEQPGDGLAPVQVAESRALAKARAVARGQTGGTVIGADTIVVDLETGDILGKPDTPEEATQMLRRLRGKEHRVITGAAVVDAASGQEMTGHRSTRVVMRHYSDQEIAQSVASGEPFDKAGGYAVQDTVLRPAAQVRGCYLNVVGLPPCTLLRLLGRVGVRVQPAPGWTPPGQCPDCRRLINVRERR